MKDAMAAWEGLFQARNNLEGWEKQLTYDKLVHTLRMEVIDLENQIRPMQDRGRLERLVEAKNYDIEVALAPFMQYSQYIGTAYIGPMPLEEPRARRDAAAALQLVAKDARPDNEAF